MNTFKKQKKKSPHGFRYRGRKGGRLENLTDTIFGFSITLLIVAAEVPETYLQIQTSMYSFIGFIFSSMLLLSIWNNHRNFFLHYGLHDKFTRTINFLFLFVLLFYIYPLKYLFSYVGTLVYSSLKLKIGDTSKGLQLATQKLVLSEMSVDQWADLVIRFGIGLLCIFGIFVILHLHALKRRRVLELTKREVFITKTFIQTFSILCLICITSILLVTFFGGMYSGHAGMIYLLVPVILPIHKHLRNKKLKMKVWKKPKKKKDEAIEMVIKDEENLKAPHATAPEKPLDDNHDSIA